MSAARLAELAAEAAARARDGAGRVLVSVAERVPRRASERASIVDPLAALERTAADASDRMYWTRPADRFELAGLGAAVSLAPDEVDRFGAVDREWTALLADALVDDPAGGTPGVGPVLMGGFSFDADGPRTRRWRDFPRARLTLPRLQLTVVGGECWLTTNLVVCADADHAADLAALAALRARLLDAPAERVTPTAGPAGAPAATAETRPAAEWRAVVGEAVTAIRGGRFEKVVLAREVRARGARAFDIGAAVRRLREAYRDCYVFAVWHGASAFVGASPERLVRLDGRRVQASSLAGSIRRGATPAEDGALVASLRASAKDHAEHRVVRESLVRSLGSLCDDVRADDEPDVLTLPQIHHLHTDVRGTLRAGHSVFDLVAGLHPTPAVGGHPREAALDFLRAHERLDRGWYAAPIGWVGRDAAEFAVGLRSALVTGDEASLFAGCGVVADSDADREYAESALKLRPMEQALGAAAVREGAA